MPIFLIPLLIIVGIALFAVGGDVLQNIDFSFLELKLFLEKKEPSVKNTKPSSTRSIIRQAAPDSSNLPPPPSSPSFSLNTTITSGPEEGSVFSDTNKVVFTFEGTVIPEDTEGRITFETKVEGFDEDWKATSKTKRTITLPAGPKEYTFLVKAKLSGERDLSPASRTFSINTSPYFGKIDIYRTRAKSGSSASLITLKSKLATGEEIVLTGWRIRGKGGSFQIPQGIENIYSTLNITSKNDIVVKRSDTILLSGEQSPFGTGRNFRPNNCMGYLKEYYIFPLSVFTSCSNDKPELEEITFFSESCQEFLLKKINYSSCKIPNYSQDISISNDRACVSYIIENFNYNACYQRYSKESNFLRNEWHIYMNKDFVRQVHDVIELTDQDGLFVDKKVY